MKLLFKTPYKSIRNLDLLELPDFVILTGVNGAGKSHLLEAIESGAIEIEGVDTRVQQRGHAVHVPKKIRKFDSNSFVPQDSGPYSAVQIINEVAGQWQQLSSSIPGVMENMRPFVKGMELPIPGAERMTARDLWLLDEEKLLSHGMDLQQIPQALTQLKSIISSSSDSLVAQFANPDPINRRRMVQKLEGASNLPLIAINEEEFFEAYTIVRESVDIFQQSFSRLFVNYQRVWRDNELKARGHEQGEKAAPLSKEDFLKRYGTPPWDFLNEILETANLSFRINQPSRWNDRPYEPLLSDVARGIEVKFSDLSSGERILMSFAFCLYHAQDLSTQTEYPEVLLFDEIDAPLHPSMTKSLLKTIQDTLVISKGIKVILATHSPSTVALSPEESIFVMQKDGPKRISSASRDSALGILTAGVPTLSVNYENRRQVFVESRYDVEFYSALYQLIRNRLLPEISITFIASGGGGGDGNCDQVIAISMTLRKAGNRTVMGLIDWDLKNERTEHVRILGSGDRYAIDNYLLDPLSVGLLLLRERWKDLKYFDLEKNETYLRVAQSGVAVLQKITNKVVEDLKGRLEKTEIAEMDAYEFKYSEGFSLLVPRWLAVLQGHRLQEVLKEVYPRFNQFRNEPDLKNAIIQKVLSDRPGLVPLQILHVMKDLQETR